jgi:preprotein translocase subunit SecD
MFDNLKARLAVIGVLIVLSIVALWPRDTTVRVRGADGAMKDTVVTQINLRRGLDLQGGIHIALELDESRGRVANRADAIDRAMTVIRTRVDEFGVAEPLVQKQGSERIIVELAGITDPARAKEIVQRSAFLEFQMTDKQGLFRSALPAMDRALTAAGVSEAGIGRQVADSAAAAAPAAAPTGVEALLAGGGADSGATAQDTARADSLLGGATAGPLSPLLFQGTMPGEFYVEEEKVAIIDAMIRHPAAERLVPRGIVIRWGSEPIARGARQYRPLYALEQHQMMTGEMLQDAQARIDPMYNQSVVDFQLSRRGGRIFERETGRRVQDNMAIVLDGRVYSAPVLRSQIGARGQIEMPGASLQEAQDLALVLKAGALPAPLQIVEERSVGPSLGNDSIRAATVAGIVAVACIVLIMLAYYRFAGVLAVTALTLYVLFTLGSLAALSATLTLPGIAGLVLSIGMAVDANVLIFERIREELALGKSVRLAIDAGFRMALSAIVDSNVTTALTAAFLFQFGTGPVRGFAVTLILGILASMLTAIFVTRTFFLVYLQRRPGLQTVSI